MECDLPGAVSVVTALLPPNCLNAESLVSCSNMKMLSGRSLKDIGVREDRVDCKTYNKFKLSIVHPEISEDEKVENKWNKFTVDSSLTDT